MSEQEKPAVRSEEPELKDEALEEVAGGCAFDSEVYQPRFTLPTPTLPIIDQITW